MYVTQKESYKTDFLTQQKKNTSISIQVRFDVISISNNDWIAFCQDAHHIISYYFLKAFVYVSCFFA